ncbi:MAG: allophanate hydrolase, partial [Actinomycetota bacterium]|nr:allophanate hydrolase [Actinomycetota bacterium]
MAEHPNVWITTVEPVEGNGPLSGMTLAVKDNIDVAGVPTTAACPAYAYTPSVSAPVVQRLVDAGAAVIGKTNLDQFATGLTGTRTPHGPCRSVLDPER